MEINDMCRRKIRAAIIMLSLPIWACVSVAFDQQETAQQIVNRSAQAYGDQWTNGKIVDWGASGKIWVNGQNGLMDFTLMVKSNGKVTRTVHPASGIDTSIGSDGKKSWLKAGPITANAAGTTAYFIDSLTKRSIASFFDKSNSMNSLGAADKKHAPEIESCQVIEAKNNKGDATRYYVDNSTSLIKRIEFDTDAVYTMLFSDTPHPAFASFVFLDYRNVDGFIIPFKIVVYQGLVKIEELTFTSVQHNTGLKDEQFVP